MTSLTRLQTRQLAIYFHILFIETASYIYLIPDYSYSCCYQKSSPWTRTALADLAILTDFEHGSVVARTVCAGGVIQKTRT